MHIQLQCPDDLHFPISADCYRESADLPAEKLSSPRPKFKTWKLAKETRHVFVKHGCPRWQQSHNMAKISKSYIFTQPHSQGHVMSVKCEEPIDELTVQIRLLYHHSNLKYCTLFVSGTELRSDGQTNRQTDRQTDDPISRCPRRTFQARGIKMMLKFTILGTNPQTAESVTSNTSKHIFLHKRYRRKHDIQYTCIYNS